MTYIDVDIGNDDLGNFQICVKNDGEIIPLKFDAKENLFVPELILGNLLTGSNFDDTQVYRMITKSCILISMFTLQGTGNGRHSWTWSEARKHIQFEV